MKYDLIIFSNDPYDRKETFAVYGNQYKNNNIKIYPEIGIVDVEFEEIVAVWFIGPRHLDFNVVRDMILKGYHIKLLDHNSMIFIHSDAIKRLSRKN